MGEYTFNMALVRTALTAGLLLVASHPLRAQLSDSVTLHLRVVDSAGVAIPLADVVVSRGNTRLVGRQTDDAGRVAFRIPRDSTLFTISARRIAFQPYRRDFAPPADDSLTIRVVLADLVEALDTVVVTDRQSVRRRNYYIDSTTIAHSGRTIFDGWDILRKLRPRIAYGLPYVPGCGGVENVWINGKWIPPEWIHLNEMVMMREPGASAATPHLNATSPPATGREAAMSIMAAVHPEHIAELSFKDCFDYAIKGLHSTNAVFIVLKPFIGFDPKRGTYDSRLDKKK